jgi:alanine racemase
MGLADAGSRGHRGENARENWPRIGYFPSMDRSLEPTSSETAAGGRLTIDLAALAHNWRVLARRVEGVATAAVVKGDAYGIGLEPAALALAEAGCHTFFVALPEEGQRLRASVRDAAIYVLDGLIEGEAETYAKFDLRPALGSWPEIEEWAAFKEQGGTTGAAIHIDTGMNRLGLTPAEARVLAEQDEVLAAVAPDLLMSHLACADEPDNPLNRKQLAAFRAVRVLLPHIPASLANSAGVFLGPDYHFDLVRPGISLYGGAAVKDAANPMRPVVTLEARVLQIREAKRGETVGYGATEALKRPSRIAILGCGYADGYHRRAGSSDRRSGARAYVNGRDAPLVGRVSMDLIAVDVTDVPGVARGDWVELFGANVPVDEVAGNAGTIGYELLTGLGRRLPRSYLGGT